MPRSIARRHQKGLSLIVALLLLLAITVLVIGAVRGTTMNERMSGNYMDRTLAFQAAEKALRQGIDELRAEDCLVMCTSAQGFKSAVSTTMPGAWDATGAASATNIGYAKSAQFVIQPLADTLRPADKTDCKAYSVMGRAQGRSTDTAVVLQTVAFACPL